MSQDWVADLYATGTVGDTTLSNMEKMFATLRSSFSGSSTPSNPVDGNLFYDTSKDLLKVYRNAAWVGALCGSAAFKLWIYLNAAEDGWLVDSSITDRVLAIKGGSQAYNVAGGSLAGNWTLSGITTVNESSHIHDRGNHLHNFLTKTISQRQLSYNLLSLRNGEMYAQGPYTDVDGGTTGFQTYTQTDGSGNTGAGSAHNHGVNHTGNDRPAAAVGTMQYPDI